VTARRSGAARIELCSNLSVGGVMPSESLIRETLLALAEDAIPVNVLVRPRSGDFVYSEEEIQETLAGIEMCKRLSVSDSAGREHRVNGVVIGALRPDGGIDVATMRRLMAAARPLQVTFHRAFDECADVEQGLEDVIALGCERLLTSGHAPDAFAGRFTLARLVRQAAGRLVILAGRGVRPHNIAAIASASSAPEFHSSTLIGW
jgi:copper homeostasis protein